MRLPCAVIWRHNHQFTFPQRGNSRIRDIDINHMGTTQWEISSLWSYMCEYVFLRNLRNLDGVQVAHRCTIFLCYLKYKNPNDKHLVGQLTRAQGNVNRFPLKTRALGEEPLREHRQVGI